MINRLKIILAAITAPFLLASCDDLRDSYEDCGVWLEFVFDHNMEYADAFGENERTVDVLVFDGEGKFYTSRHAAVEELDGRKRMFLGDPDMPFGAYSVIAVAGLDEHFRLSDRSGGEFVPGATTIEQAALALRSAGGESSDEFPHLWFSRGPVEIDYKANLSVWPVPLIRETNKINVALRRNADDEPTRAPVDPIFDVEITAPEPGAYDYRNEPYGTDGLIYRPYYLASDVTRYDDDTGEFHTTEAKLNTMRLLTGSGEYRLVIRDYETGEAFSNLTFDLLDLLGRTKPNARPDGTPLTLQEYLDRQGEWNIVIIYNEGDITIEDPTDPPYVAVRIIVNNWIVWESGVGL